MINKKTEELIVTFEGEKLTSYLDTGGVWTIGVGRTSGSKLTVQRGQTITKTLSRELLYHDLKEAEGFVKALVKVPLNENQYGALVSFTFNVGGGSFKSSTLLRKLNAGDYKAVPSELMKWVNDNGKRLDGLVRRRSAEGALWNTSTSAPVAPQKPVQRVEPKVAENVPVDKQSESGAFIKVIGAIGAAGAIALGKWLGLY